MNEQSWTHARKSAAAGVNQTIQFPSMWLIGWEMNIGSIKPMLCQWETFWPQKTAFDKFRHRICIQFFHRLCVYIWAFRVVWECRGVFFFCIEAIIAVLTVKSIKRCDNEQKKKNNAIENTREAGRKTRIQHSTKLRDVLLLSFTGFEYFLDKSPVMALAR